jgi:hypothetical protein
LLSNHPCTLSSMQDLLLFDKLEFLVFYKNSQQWFNGSEKMSSWLSVGCVQATSQQQTGINPLELVHFSSKPCCDFLCDAIRAFLLGIFDFGEYVWH